jgi:exopolysaccharide biosynthesis polyprenyl glycosylphosphotransferase
MAPSVNNSATSEKDGKGVVLHPTSAVFGEDRERASRFNARKAAVFVADLNAVALSLFLGALVATWVNPSDPVATRTYFWFLLLTLPVWPITFARQYLYRARHIARSADEAERVARAILYGFVALLVISIFTGEYFSTEAVTFRLAPTVIVVSFLFMFVIVGIERAIARWLFKRARTSGQNLRNVLIVGKNAEGAFVRDMLDKDPSLGYKVLGYLEDELPNGIEGLADSAGALSAINEVNAGGVIIAATGIEVGTSNQLIRTLTENDIHVELSSTLCDIASDRLTIRPLGRFPMVYIEPVERNGWRRLAKQAFDYTFGLVMFILLSPILLGAMLAIKLTSPGPIFFKQVRIGRDGEEFEVYKLRTMVTDAEALLENVRHLNEAKGPIFKIKDDPRITRVGKILRKTSIDELPQFINVLRGEMSVVGPRPALPNEVAEWQPVLRNRLRVQPGITGMWQVGGRLDGENDDEDYGQLDLYYVDNWTLVTDLTIILRTVPAVLMQKGSY